jgi:hypothetical protein
MISHKDAAELINAWEAHKDASYLLSEWMRVADRAFTLGGPDKFVVTMSRGTYIISKIQGMIPYVTVERAETVL